MTETTAALICPKCGGSMRSYERNGIVVDQCTECRGIFLDRGELERLVEGENAYYAGGRGGVARGEPEGPIGGGFDRPYSRPPLDAPYRRDPRYGDRFDDDDDDDRYGGRRRGGFLGGLLDFD